MRDSSNQHTWTRRDYKKKLFNKVVKVFVDELNKRFDGSVCDLLRSMALLIPSSSHFLDIDTLKPFARHYALDERLLESEMDVFSAQYRIADPGCKWLLDMLYSEGPDGLWIMDILDLKSIKSIIHGFLMDLDEQIPNPMNFGWI